MAGHRAHRFGASSETAEQLQLALETSEIAAAAMTARMRLLDIEEKDKPKRRPIPHHIPRMEVELTSGADACADCGGRLRRIGHDVAEELEYVPGRFIVNRIVRPRLTCACCERFVQAPLPSRPIERGRPGPGLLAHVLVSKYADHLPSVIRRVWSMAMTVQRAGPCFCPWSARRHKMRTMPSAARVAFVAEVRSLAHVLGQSVGRTFQATCDAALGDARCGVDLEDPAYKGAGAVLDLLRDRAFTA